jgi:hypothetical protein
MNAIELESRYSAHNYAPPPVVLTRGQGAHLWPGGYVDMMSAYSAGGEPRPRRPAHPCHSGTLIRASRSVQCG